MWGGEGGLLVPESGSQAGRGAWRKAACSLGTVVWRKVRVFALAVQMACAL